jgi:hypothetical protein
LLLKNYLYNGRFIKFFYKRNFNKSNKDYIKNFESDVQKQIVRKFNLDIYSLERFEKKIGLDMFRFVSRISSYSEDSQEYKELKNKIYNTKTLGRKNIIKIDKKHLKV